MTARRADVPTQEAPWAFAAPWGARGWVSDLDGPVHWISFGDGTDDDGIVDGPADTGAPPIVFVHGLGGSHLNWTLVGPALAQGRRAYALDLHGFGVSPGVGGNTTVHANAALVRRFVREIVGEPAILVGNSMGGMVSILHAHRYPESVAGLVLVDPALPTPRRRPDVGVASQFLLYAVPGFGELYMRNVQAKLTSRQLVERVVKLCFADPSRASKDVLDAGVALAEERRSIPGKEESFLRAARSLMRVLVRPDQYRTMMRGIQVPTLLIGGEADRLVPIAAMHAAAADNPGWQTLFLPGVGHTPQLESPAAVIDAVAGWLGCHPALATR